MMPTGEATTAARRRRQAADRLVLGFDGLTPSAETRALIQEIQPGGLILFARNVASPHQVAELNRELASWFPANRPPLRMVDQEGGRVQRIREPATRWPPMRAVGHHPDAVPKVAAGLGSELRAMGFDLNLAPVADVDSNPDNPVIGDRAFSDRPRQVAHHMRAFIPAHQSAGVLACAKHFPGHGDTTVDSHLDLPVVLTDVDTLLTRELAPFRAAIHADVASIMSAHVVYATLDPHHPATLSERVIPTLLRHRLGFDGLVLSDDLEMKAVDGRYAADEIATRATRATVDLLLMCHTPDKQIGLFEALIRAQESDRDIDQQSAYSAQRLQRVRQRLAHPARPAPDPHLIGAPNHQRLAASLTP